MTNLWLTNIFQIRKCQVTVFKILNLTLHIKLIFWGGDFFFFWGGGGGGGGSGKISQGSPLPTGEPAYSLCGVLTYNKVVHLVFP